METKIQPTKKKSNWSSYQIIAKDWNHKKLSKTLTPKQFKIVSHGLFTSKLIYCLQLFCNTWTFQNITKNRFTTFTKESSRKLQVLQNKVLRLRTGLDIYTPTATLLEKTNELSVNQLGAFHTLLSVHKAVTMGKPEYLQKNLTLRTPVDGNVFPAKQKNKIVMTKAGLTLTKGGFCHRGTFLWNLMPVKLRSIQEYKKFKPEMKTWVFKNIPQKPLR